MRHGHGQSQAEEAQVPAGLEVHIIVDNYGTHKTAIIRKWFAKRPRFHPFRARWDSKNAKVISGLEIPLPRMPGEDRPANLIWPASPH